MKTNTNHSKKIFLFLFSVLLPLLANAQVKINGVYYNLDQDTKQAEVTSGSANYAHSVIIPATVSYEGVDYNVTSIGDWAFDYCGNLKSITIPESVTKIGKDAFLDCSSLTAVYISNVENWCNISFDNFASNPLYYAKNLYIEGKLVAELTIPEGVTSIGNHAFRYCSSIKSINIPESVTSIGDCAFTYCTNLLTIILPKNSQLTCIGNSAFSGCRQLIEINIPEGVTNIGSSAFSGCSRFTSINIPEEVTSIGDNTFLNCTRLTSINIPENSQLVSIGHQAFCSCSNLTSINIPEGVTSIGDYAFQNCSNLTTINISKNSQLTSIGNWAFKMCSNLTAITIPKSVMSIGGEAFYYCTSLSSIDITENSQLMSIGYDAFYYCRTLTGINIPENVASIGKGAFRDCINLTTVNIPKGVTSIEDKTFQNCSSLTAINIPESVTSIGWYAFRGCSSLTAINIPEKVTGIKNNTFQNCSSLTAIVLPKGLKRIFSEAFANCKELLNVYCYAETVPLAETDAFDDSCPEFATLHVPASAIENYKMTSPWSSFGAFEVLEIVIEDIILNQTTCILTEGETLTLSATTNPEDANNPSLTWNSSDPTVATVDNTGRVTAVAPGTATITATANDGSGMSASCEITVKPASYVITFLIDGEQFFVQTLARGSAITLPEVPAKEGYIFSGWGEVPETMPAKDVTISGTFIANKYLVTFKIGDEIIAADSLEYGAAIVVPEAPEKKGHTFNGWSEVPETVPANDVTVEGSYSVNSYLLVYMVDGVIIQADSVTYGSVITLLDEPTKEGYTFSGWGEAPETMPANDVTISGTFNINQYTVTYVIDGEVFATDTITYGESITLPDVPTKEGYDFAWTDEIPETMPAKDIVINGSYTTGIIKAIVEANVLYIYTTDGQRVNELRQGINIVLLKDGSIRKVFHK